MELYSSLALFLLKLGVLLVHFNFPVASMKDINPKVVVPKVVNLVLPQTKIEPELNVWISVVISLLLVPVTPNFNARINLPVSLYCINQLSVWFAFLTVPFPPIKIYFPELLMA